jgi:DNA-binding MarR family transcriptional regulator
MFESRGGTNASLLPLEMRILKFIKPKSQTEKKIAKSLEVDSIVLSPMVTDLILKGYLEIFRRRKMYFFTQEMCTITPEGISALDMAMTPLQSLLEMIRSKAMEALNGIVSESPALKVVAMSARTIYKVAKVIV